MSVAVFFSLPVYHERSVILPGSAALQITAGTRFLQTHNAYLLRSPDRIGSFNKVLVYMFYLYNKVGAMFKYPKRAKAFRNALRALNRRYIIFRDRS